MSDVDRTETCFLEFDVYVAKDSKLCTKKHELSGVKSILLTLSKKQKNNAWLLTYIFTTVNIIFD